MNRISRNEWFQRNNFFTAMGTILLAVLFAGCSGGRTDKIIIRGSNTIGEELAPVLIEEYQKAHPGVTFDTEFKGTSYGSGALMVGRCDISAASRDLTQNELELAKDRGIEFNDYLIGYYGVAVVVNAGNPVANLTADQVRDIFTGETKNWNEVGGPDAPIHVYVRDPISGTHLGFQEVAMEKKPYAHGMKTFTNYDAIVQTVGHDKNGIGYSSLELANKTGAKAISIGGVAPTADTVNKGKYPYARALRLFTDKAKETTPARNFILFVQSPAGQKVVEQMGCVPRP